MAELENNAKPQAEATKNAERLGGTLKHFLTTEIQIPFRLLFVIQKRTHDHYNLFDAIFDYLSFQTSRKTSICES